MDDRVFWVGLALIFVGLLVLGYAAYWALYGRQYNKTVREYKTYFDSVMDELDEEYDERISADDRSFKRRR